MLEADPICGFNTDFIRVGAQSSESCLGPHLILNWWNMVGLLWY
jgi:hypothetical protein